ncbi:MAG TPA: hypothetical protein VLA09_09400, partial [Longimicrobiales bacterium]|nr:hypothetical protein [Longimicrobiales bacterium]
MRRLAVLAVAALFVACEAAPDPTGLDELSFAPAFAITTVSGIDAGAASGDARPNADAAAASFDAEIAALGNFFIENLEGAPLGSFTSLAVLAAT